MYTANHWQTWSAQYSVVHYARRVKKMYRSLISHCGKKKLSDVSISNDMRERMQPEYFFYRKNTINIDFQHRIVC